MSATVCGSSVGAVERHERVGPIERLGDARRLEQVERSQALRDGDDFARQRLRSARAFPSYDRKLTLGIWIVDPLIQAPPFDRVVNLARAIRRDHDDRRHLGRDRAQFRNRDLILGEHLEQVRLERRVGAIELVDQQHRRDAVGRRDRLQ